MVELTSEHKNLLLTYANLSDTVDSLYKQLKFSEKAKEEAAYNLAAYILKSAGLSGIVRNNRGELLKLEPCPCGLSIREYPVLKNGTVSKKFRLSDGWSFCVRTPERFADLIAELHEMYHPISFDL